MSNNKLSTKGASLDPPAGTGIRPIIHPGNHEIHILSTEVRKGDGEFGDKVTLKVETRPLPAPFKGLAKNKEDASAGSYAGQVGWVSLSRWGFKDGETPNGFVVVRDDEMFRSLGVLCRDIGLGLAEWWDNQDGKHETVDQLYAAFEKDKPYQGVWFHACIAGKEYMNGQYVNYELFFNRETRETGKPFSLNKDKVQKYFESSHLVRLQPKGEVNASSTGSEAPKSSATATAESKQPAPTSSSPDQKQPAPAATSNNLDFLNQGQQQAAPANEPLPDLDAPAPWEM